MTTDDRTIQDFGDQWGHYQDDNTGYYGSVELLKDLVEPLLPVEAFRGAKAVDIGSGTGRIVKMLAAAGTAHITAVEPSSAVEALQKNISSLQTPIDIQNVPGDAFKAHDLDLAVSFGVLHHIPDPDPVVRNVLKSLKPGGKFLVWLYGQEGNELYLAIFQPVRAVTTRLPHRLLEAVSYTLASGATLYGQACRALRLPMRDYFCDHFMKLSFKVRMITVYDQLNPQHAKYYSKDEAIDLLQRNGFTDVQVFHRHGYSWTAIGTKPSLQ